MYKTDYDVTITPLGGNEGEINDSTDPGQGKSAWNSLQTRSDITVKVDGETVFIPFHAVGTAVLTKTTTEVERPLDVNCPEGDVGGVGLVDSAIVDESITG